MLRTTGTSSDGVGTVGRRRKRALPLAALVACLVLALGATAAHAALPDYSGGAYQILAPGDEGAFVPGQFATDQAKLYDDLTPLKGQVSQSALESFYLPEKFGVVGPVKSVVEPKPGLKIERDNHDIPHVFGETREDVMFGSGWIAAQDRGLILALGLGPAFAAADDVPGINPFGLLLNGRQFTPSAETFKFVAEQEKVLVEEGPKGLQVIKDLEEWANGINAYEETLGSNRQLPPISLPYAIAGFAFIGAIFGNGGGNEVADSQLLANLQAHLGSEEGLKVFRDLREVNDPEAPTTTTKPFPYDGVPTGPTPGALVVEPGSVSASAVKAAAVAKASRRKASNFLVIGASRTKNGHPIAVMGPQLGYFYPEIVMQADLHGPGVDAQGIIAPISPYVFIGRGRDFAWSLTSAGSENTQTFLEKLCNPNEETEGAPTRSSTHYLYKGECIPLVERDAGELGAGEGEGAREVHFLESVHGPIQGTALVGGKPFAIAKDRSTRGREPAGELAFSELDSDEVHNPQQFFEAANHLETTFNMSYLDSKHIAYFSTGRLPILAPGTDPSLPTLGTGEYDWQGFLPLEAHPHEVDPASSLFLNWNNKPAPEWGAASDQFSYGPVYRVQMYNGFKTHAMTEPEDVSIMNRAATQDLRAIADWPLVNEVLSGSPPPSALAGEAVTMLNEWVKHKASRLGTERPLAQAAAIMDAVWQPIGEAVLSPVLGSVINEFKGIAGPDDPPSSVGSAFGSGWEGYVSKDLRRILGQPETAPFSRIYCGNGSLEACRNSLWEVVQHAVEKLSAEQGSNPKHWHAAKVRITFPPDPAMTETMRWTNRSTFQQVIEFTGHAEE